MKPEKQTRRQNRIRVLQILAVTVTVIVGFQNCGQMSAKQGLNAFSDSSVSQPSGAGPVAPPPPNKIPATVIPPIPSGNTSGMLPALLASQAPGNIIGMPDPTVTGHKIQVCPAGCAYNNLSGAMAAVVDGDTIEIAYGDYVDCANIGANNLIIRGISDAQGNKPHFHGKVCARKGILVVTGTNTLIDNLEISNAQDTGFGDYNWAGIRFDTVPGAANLKVRNCYFHDDDDGILGTNQPATQNILDIQNNVFFHCGRAGYAHGMYIGAGITHLILRNNVVSSNIDDGHLVKTRALNGLIECNTIESLNGFNSFAIDIPQGGNYLLRGNTIENGPNIKSSSNFILKFAGENANNSPHKLQLIDNYIVNDYTVAGLMFFMTPTDTTGWSSNTYAGSGGALTFSGSFSSATAGDSFKNYPSRAAAALKSFDGTDASLPPHPTCLTN